MPRALALIPLLLASTGICIAQKPCNPEQQASLARQALQLQSRLRASDAGSMSTAVPQSAQALLPEFKAALIEVAGSVAECHNIASSPAAIQSVLVRLLHSNAPQPPPNTAVSNGDPRYREWSSQAYGSNLVVQATRESPTLLSIQFSFHLLCGDDAVYLVFEAQNQAWMERLVWQAPPYTEISSAFGDFFLTAILPAVGTRPWRIVAAHGHPWCTSRFSGFNLDLLEPSVHPEHPKIIWHTARGYSRGDYRPRLKSAGQVFELRTNVPAISSEDFERTVVYRFVVEGDNVKRIGPIAVNGLGFVGEWLNAPWDEAAAFSDASNLAQLKKAYECFQTSCGGKETWAYTSGPVLACHDDAKHFEAELDVHDPHTGTRASYYQIYENGEGYTMKVAGASRPDMGCVGLDLRH